jgi:hypothetical protein
MKAAPLSRQQIEASRNHVTLPSTTTPHLFSALFTLVCVSILKRNLLNWVLYEPQLNGPLALCVRETESRHSKNGLPHAVLADGLYVRTAYCAHLARSWPWALAVAVALLHRTLAKSKWTLQGLTARRGREPS